MRKILTATILSVLASTVLAGGFLHANAAESGTDDRTDSLFLPSSYEQYLPLSDKPSDVAVSDNYTAIADGKKIYVYNRAENEYNYYEHTSNVAQVAFSENGYLYFSDELMHLYKTTPANLSQTPDGTIFSISAFTLSGTDIYYSTAAENSTTKIRLDKLNADNQSTDSIVENLTSKPAIALDGDQLYYTDAGKYLRKYGTDKSVTLTEETVVSMTVSSGLLYYTDTAGSLFCRNLATPDEPLKTFDGTGYSALSAYGQKVYVVRNSSIKEIDPDETGGTFTDYEIGSSSDSPNRLSGATRSTLVKNELFVADGGNERVSITNTLTGKTTVIPVGFAAEQIASDGETVAVASGTTLKIFDRTGALLLDTEAAGANNPLASPVKDVTAVYGTYYLVTEGNVYHSVTNGENGWTVDSGAARPSSPNAKLLTSDIRGRLYVACTDGGVYRYTEAEFTDPEKSGIKAASIPPSAEQLLVDYEGTVYALYENELYAGETGLTKYPLGKTAAYTQTTDTKLRSVAFGVESREAYLLYEGDFIVKTYDLPLPTVNAIPTADVDESIFSEGEAPFSIVTTAENALFVDFDIQTLDGADCFPYLAYRRERAQKTAIKLGDAGKYSVLAIFNSESKRYVTSLVLSEDCEETDDVLLPAEGFDGDKGYISNPVTLYKYPYLTDLLTVTRLEKNAEVKVLGMINDLDYRYYYVEIAGENGTQKGYVPQGYVTPFDGTPKTAEESGYGAESANRDSVWRLTFILLGGAIVCILTDWLILRKKD